MKQLLLLFLFSCSLYLVQAQVRPVNSCTNASFSAIDGASVSFYFTKPASGAGANRVIIAKKASAVTALPADGTDYLDNSNFGAGTQIAPGEFVVYDGAATSVSVYNLEPNTTYYFAVFEYNGTGSNTLYLTSQYLSFNRSTATTPAAQAQNIVFADVRANSVKINCTLPAGSGAGRIIVMKAGSPVDATAIPQDLQGYSANGIFGSGFQFPTGNYVVYSGTGTTATVSGLLANVTYHVSIMEYNGSSKPVYLTANPATASFTTAERPTQFVTGVHTTSVEGNSMNVRWGDLQANGIGRLVIAREGQPVTAVPVDGQVYTASTNFGEGTEVMPGQYVMYKGINYNFDARKLKHGTVYYFTVFEYANGSAGPVYLTSGAPSASGTTLAAPTQQASNLTISNITNNSMRLSWVNGNGNNRIIVGRKDAPVNALPDLFKKYYPGNFGYSQALVSGDNYVLYDASGAAGATMNTTITGLASASQYHFAIFEYNGNSSPVYQTANPAVASDVTAARPSVAAQNLSFTVNSIEGNSLPLTWTNGNGTGRIVVARKGSAVTAIPADGVAYNTDNVFGSLNSTEMAPGEFVVYNGSGSSFTVSGLEIGTTYHFRVYEYAGNGSTLQYLTTAFASGNRTTLSAPTAAASNLVIDNITNTSMRLTWSVAPTGGGAYHMVIAKEAGPVDGSPVNLTRYNASGFGSGQTVAAGNYVVYYATGNSVTVTNLKPGTTYHYKIVEANGYNGPVYLNAMPLTGSSITLSTPTTAASGFSYTNLESNSVNIKWTNGTGAKRIVVAREDAAVTAVPLNGATYNADAGFGAGSSISTSEFVVYNGAASNATVSNLRPGHTYYFRVYEYNEVNTTPSYLTASYLSGSVIAKTTPTQQATNLQFSSLASTSVTLGWTAGNSDNYLVVARAGHPVSFIPADFSIYSFNAAFGASTNLGNDHYAIYAGSGTSVTVSNLVSGTTYYFTVFACNGANAPVYLTTIATNANNVTTLGAPATQASNLAFGTYANGTVQLNWVAGSGNRRIILVKEGAAVDGLPANNKDYTANSVFKSGEQIGNGNYVVYNGAGTTAVINGLNPTLSYYFTLFEYNQFGPNNNSYLTADPAAAMLAPAATLPVTWVNFTGTFQQNTVQLKWTTSEEVNNAFYEVERSANGLQFETIGKVIAYSTTANMHSYSFTDRQLLQQTVYYRIKQVDKDGRFSYSKVISVKNGDHGKIQILQNPVHNSVRLKCTEEQLGDVLIITDAAGRVMYKTTITSELTVIATDRLTAGVYYISVRDKNGKGVNTIPFVRQ